MFDEKSAVADDLLLYLKASSSKNTVYEKETHTYLHFYVHASG